MDPFSPRAVRAAYDTAAADYVVAFGDDLARLPVDRSMLDAALGAAAASPGGPSRVLDLGCGPAFVGSYLADGGATVTGVDLSAEMLRIARGRDPRLGLVQGDLRDLPFAAGSGELAVAYYSIQHLPRADLGVALDEIRRVLVADGSLLLATHLGEGDVVMEDFLGHDIEPVGGALYRRDELLGPLWRAGFTIDTERERAPLPHEHDSRRIYLLARRRSG